MSAASTLAEGMRLISKDDSTNMNFIRIGYIVFILIILYQREKYNIKANIFEIFFKGLIVHSFVLKSIGCISLNAENDVDEGCDIGDGDGAILVDVCDAVVVTVLWGILAEDNVDEGCNIADSDDAVTVDVT